MTVEHTIVVRDFGPDGTGISVVVHRAGCECPSVDDRDTVIRTERLAAHEDKYERGGAMARAYGLASEDFAVSDCALRYSTGR